MKTKVTYHLFILFTLFLAISFLPRVVYDYDPNYIRQTQFFTFVRILLLLAFLTEMTRGFYRYVVKGSLKSWSRNGLLILFSVFCLYTVAEIAFMFVAKSHFAGLPLSTKIWFYRYWKPLNNYGFRDKPVDPAKQVNIFVLGDSYTAGHGIKEISNRFSNILDRRLAARFRGVQVINLGVNGADTQDELSTLRNFIKKSKIRPDLIILQYFGNDIEKAAKSNGVVFSGFNAYSDLPGGLDQAVKSSYFFNYLYWAFPHSNEKNYINFLIQSYHDEPSMTEHLKDLDLFIDYSNSEHVPLLILIFPFMQDIDFSEALYIKPLSSYFASRNIPCIDISPLIRDIPLENRIINKNDGHSSVLVNRIVADTVYGYLCHDGTIGKVLHQ